MNVKRQAESSGKKRPNILVLCMDQWQTQMQVPEEVRLPALRRIESQGVTFDRHYCTVALCTPARATMWTGLHANHTGLWDNTNFAWIDELSPEVPTIGHLLRQQGYYTAFKGKWHLSTPPRGEDALERFGFADYQQWGDMYGSPLQGAKLDPAATFETVDWLETKGSHLDQPWMLVCSLINPHDIMFLKTDPVETPHPNGAMAGLQTTAQRLGWFAKQWDVTLPANYQDTYKLQPMGVRAYKEYVDLNYGPVPDERTDLWLARRNYLLNAMRLVDTEFLQILETLDRRKLWDNTVVLFMSDHGEMNGGHRMAQKGAIHFDEATVVNLTVCMPDGPKGQRTAAVGSHLDLAPTLLSIAGLDEDEIAQRYPQLKGRSLLPAVLDPAKAGPRGSAADAGDGALFCWDALNMLDAQWGITGALPGLATMTSGPPVSPEEKRETMLRIGRQYGAPDFSRRTFYRAVVDGRYKLVRWFSPLEYGNPATLEELYSSGDVTLHDLVNDPEELENIGHPNHPKHDLAVVERMLGKLHTLVEREIGEDRAPFDLDLLGTREVRYHAPRERAA